MSAAPRPASLKLMVFPRDRNPYQSLLYGAMAEHGVAVTYVGQLTPSRTVNLLALPLELLIRRMTGHRVLHLHWLFPFAFPGRDTHRSAGLPAQAVFWLFLWSLRASGVKLVWTAHNLLPHAPVFWDDELARRWLLRRADLVIAHSKSASDELRQLGLEGGRSVVIPHGPFPLAPPAELIPEVLGADHHDTRRVFAFVGNIQPYKGVEDLVLTFTELAPEDARLVIAGECPSAQLRQRLIDLAAATGQVHLCLRRLSEGEMSALLRRVDILVLPFRRVTTSGSALYGLGAGVPLVIPDLLGLDELPSDAVFRYDPVGGLADGLAQAAAATPARLQMMSDRGRAFVAGRSWETIATMTVTTISGLFDRVGDGRSRSASSAGRR